MVQSVCPLPVHSSLSISRLALSSVVLSSIENGSKATVLWKTDAALLVAVVCFIGFSILCLVNFFPLLLTLIT